MKTLIIKRLLLILTLLLTIPPSGYPQNGNWLAWHGKNKTRAGHYTKAVDFFQRALKKDSTNYNTNIKLEQIYLYEFELFDAAEKQLAKALRHQKKDIVYTYYDYARCLQSSEKLSEALAQYAFLNNIISTMMLLKTS